MSIVYNGHYYTNNKAMSIVYSGHYYTNDKAMSIVYNGLTTIQMIKQCPSYITVSLLYKW